MIVRKRRRLGLPSAAFGELETSGDETRGLRSSCFSDRSCWELIITTTSHGTNLFACSVALVCCYCFCFCCCFIIITSLPARVARPFALHAELRRLIRASWVGSTQLSRFAISEPRKGQRWTYYWERLLFYEICWPWAQNEGLFE